MLARQFLRDEAQWRCQEQKLEEIFAGAISLDKDVTGQYETSTMKKGHRQHQRPLEGKQPIVDSFQQGHSGDRERDTALHDLLVVSGVYRGDGGMDAGGVAGFLPVEGRGVQIRISPAK